MRRRSFLALVGGLAALPVAAGAQRAAVPVIGILGGATATVWAPYLTAFRQGLNETGFAEGRNVAMEYRWAGGEYDRLPAMAADLVGREVSVIVAFTSPAALAAKAATATIPIVFTTIGDPVELRLVASLGRPGANATGVTYLELAPKLLDLMQEVVPGATIIALLLNPTNPNSETLSRDLQARARTLGVQLHTFQASSEGDIDKAFTELAALGAGALLVGGDTFLNARSGQLAALALRHRMPSIYQGRVFPAAGGLMSYGGSALDSYRQAGVYTGRILRGEKPADLPVLRPTKFNLVINLKTASALGLEIPTALLARADEILE